jgi:branched-subunit amino acid aminotransferase/4-amino-4-deoxychorismate lyase
VCRSQVEQERRHTECACYNPSGPSLPVSPFNGHTGRMKTPLAYLNGRWIAGSELSIGVDDVGFLLGATVAERLRTFRGQVFRLEEHLDRMRRSLAIVGLDAERLVSELAVAVPEFVERNRALAAADDDWTVIAFVTPGAAGSGQPTVCVHGFPLMFGQWAAQYERGLSVNISDIRQVPPECWPPELKCRSRMHYYLADLRAANEEPGARALLLDQEGYVAEASTANVVVYRESEGLVSPPGEHVLVGVSLGVVQELAAELGVPFARRNLSVEELHAADEAYLAGTSICLMPIVRCNGRPIGGGTPGPMFERLLKAWSDLVGVDIAAQAQRFASRPTTS